MVVYRSASISAASTAQLKSAGGTVVATYPQIGVAVVSSSASNFSTAVLKDAKVDGVSATEPSSPTKLKDPERRLPACCRTRLPSTPATDTDSLSGLQWDMRQIHTPEAHAINGRQPVRARR